MAQLEKGEKAPHFEGINQDNKSVKLSDYAGKKLILYFYPKDNTPGCTAESCDLSNNYNYWLGLGFEVLGISPDSVESHQKFIAKHSLPFSLIADTEHKILEAYGAWGEKNLYGKKSIGVIRTTYVISEDGIIEEVFKRVKTKEHTEQIKKKLELE